MPKGLTRRAAVLVPIAIFLAGCASRSVETLSRTSVPPGAEDVSVLGNAVVWRETGSTERTEQWQGIMFGGMHRAFRRGDDYRRAELIYGGRQGADLLFIFQETAGNDAAPRVRRPYTVPLASDGLVTVAGARLQILDATASSVRFRFLGWPSTT